MFTSNRAVTFLYRCFDRRTETDMNSRNGTTALHAFFNHFQQISGSCILNDDMIFRFDGLSSAAIGAWFGKQKTISERSSVLRSHVDRTEYRSKQFAITHHN